MNDTTKYCKKCDRHLPLSRFSKDKYKKCGLRNYCKDCELIRVKAWDAENIEKRRAYQVRAYYADIEKTREQNRDYTRRNKEKYKFWIREGHKRFREKHPELLRARSRIYYKRKTNHPDFIAMYAAQNGECRYCHVPLGDSYHIDHMLPLFRGGTNDMSNIALCCADCNRQKGKRTPEEWLGEFWKG